MLEVNTRVQVEHPVTEMITGVDIVAETIKVTAGEKLSVKQDDVKVNGHAIEVRVNAEDPDRNFMPQAGTIETFVAPGGPGVRWDSHVRPGYRIPPNYDSMIGKLIVHGNDRSIAIERMKVALDEFVIGPIKTTIPIHKEILKNPVFRKGQMFTDFIPRMMGEKENKPEASDKE